MAWFPDDEHVGFVGYFNEDLLQTQLIILSTNGKLMRYDQIPTTDGYNIIGISSLPALQK